MARDLAPDEVARLQGDAVVVRRHAPQVAWASDGTWAVYCAACSGSAEDYVYPCLVKPDATEPSGHPFWPPANLIER